MFRYSTALGRQLLTYVLAFSFVITLLSLFYILYSDYQRGLQQYDENLEQIENSYRKSLSYSLWNFDANQIDAQLHGILNFPGVVYTYIENNDEVLYSSGNVYNHVDQHHQFGLSYDTPTEHYPLGVLHISLDYSQLHQELTDQTVNILLTQFVKTFTISIFLLFIVHQLITRRLYALAEWAQDFSLDTPKGPLLKHRRNDEISAVNQAIHQMLMRLRQDIEEQKKSHQQFEHTRNQLTIAVDNAGIGFCTYNAEANKLDSNSHFAGHLATTELELESVRHPINELVNRIEGPESVQQRERINQLFIGRLSRVHDLIWIRDFQQTRRYLEITLQISRYRDTRPAEIMICTVDRTQEQLALEQSRELTLSLENKVTARTEDLYNEQLRSKATIRKLEQDLERTASHYSSESQKEINQLLLKQLHQLEPLTDAETRPRIQAFMEYLSVSESSPSSSIDLALLIRRWAEQTFEADKQPITDLPFSLIIEENPDVFYFLLNHLVLRKCRNVSASDCSIGLKLNRGMIEIKATHSGQNNQSATQSMTGISIADRDIDSLCEHLVSTRFQGQLTTEQAENEQSLTLLLSIRNH